MEPPRTPFALLTTGLLLALTPSCRHMATGYRYDPPEKGEPMKGSSAVKISSSAARGTLLGIARHPVTTAVVGAAVLWQRPRELVTANVPGIRKYHFAPEEAPGTDRFEALLDKKDLPQPIGGKITWLVDGHRFYPELEREIAKARQTIDVQAYIFDNDDAAVRVADQLKRRSAEAQVRVIFDDLGSSSAAVTKPETPFPPGFEPPSNMSRYLRDGSAVKVRSMLNPWLVCDHTKLHVFDGRVALMGCMNIGREYRSEWHDLMFRVEGSAVGELQRDYDRTWKRAAPFGLPGLGGDAKKPYPVPVAGEVPIRILRTDPAVWRYEIQKAMLLGIRAARKRIWIEDPYIANDDITEALEDAVKRGVDVRVIFPGRNDSKLMDVANRAFANKLVEAGGKAYAYPGMTHLKAMICDDWACVGSANLDTLSMRINRELNISFRAKAPLRELITKVFEPDFARSKPHVPAKEPGGAVMEAVADQL
ncbi:phosphatidylserine/phosphatidylglycerophosphate/cardiolipin synthase family protein [Luteolibacter arcticus]|uniref:Phosphatidylserine/phosphatidylglycerophosphate/ cardiolipin synthase family protein n=1 Tax=Luteolibacter arcticus TaxID=1581411 RepID=A0ABT3GQW2_9BACT|nr:phosphatidylserine/phosphatidylglycerophosphate/cardiolipin synthase family protein [Luteolibacter arcticus]MCW1925898.1 phosphatidylserine/phosphatidylglycerophosphate/cardiolipin synthase family protein [Luteolibacter arcticus]